MEGSSLPGHKSGRLHFIQYLRGGAAIMVLVHHALNARRGVSLSFESDVNVGRLGVLIFFVISGFVMMHACRNEAVGDFLKRRFIRIVPLYWLLTLVYLAVLLPNDLAAGDPFRRAGALVQSFLFIPHWHTGVPTEIWPVLTPGWTLNYEMFFFFIFAIGIGAGRPAQVSTAILCALVAVGWLVPMSSPILITWTSAFLLLFVAGIILALFWHRFNFSVVRWGLPFGLLIVLLEVIDWVPQEWGVFAYFLAGIMIVAGTLSCEERYPEKRFKFLGLLGDSSYSIYLSHTILMIPLYKVLQLLPLAGWPQFLAVFFIALVTCTGFGILLYRAVERPVIRRLRIVFDKPHSKGR
ncbi:acyltransferase family protein [Shimia sp. MMG029]|uniref:acyltransferase family protein n=1 Tax=Shimia sp. MMG029 TaxID=3021978 RepID=UPI0022FDC5E9|nr:acyltransferase [Shimia sp. MMG029]MDA5558128.1 acyltransferase [Shimia sp. MMG029]